MCIALWIMCGNRARIPDFSLLLSTGTGPQGGVMTSLFFLACVLIAGAFGGGVVVGRVLERWAYPRELEFDKGYQTALQALGFIYEDA